MARPGCWMIWMRIPLRISKDCREFCVIRRVEFEINPRLVRGLDYYNRTVFEWITGSLGAQGTICAGGRYDGLVEQMWRKGISVARLWFCHGSERVLALMVECGMDIAGPVPDAYVMHQGEAADGFAWKTVRHLRARGLRVILHCGNGNFKAQMKKADASGARFAIIIGDEEAQSGEISIKPLREAAEQARVTFAEAADLLRGSEVIHS